MEIKAFNKLLSDIKNKIISGILDLSHKEINNEQVCELAEALTHNQNITTLYLCGNQIGNEGAIVLAQNQTITTLNLAGNQIGAAGIQALAQNQTITTLYFSGDKTVDEEVQMLSHQMHIVLNITDDKDVKMTEINEVLPTNSQTWALHVAAANDDPVALLQLVTTRPTEINRPNGSGRTPLHIACEKDLAKNVKVLLDVPSIDINLAQNQGKTPLLIAMQLKNTKIVSLLLASKKLDFEQEGNKVAKLWCEQAAAQGNANAQNSLGVLHYKGQGVPQDYELTKSWYEKAAAQGHARAQNNLRILVAALEKAAAFEKIAAQGDPKVQYELGLLYNYGRGGVPQDYEKAKFWNDKAAEQNYEDAQYNRGVTPSPFTL